MVPIVGAGTARILRRGGGSVFFDPVQKDYMAIAAGTLDSPTGLRTVVQIHVASASDYYRIDDTIPQRLD